MEKTKQQQMALLWIAANSYKISNEQTKIVMEAFLGGCKFMEGEISGSLLNYFDDQIKRYQKFNNEPNVQIILAKKFLEELKNDKI